MEGEVRVGHVRLRQVSDDTIQILVLRPDGTEVMTQVGDTSLILRVDAVAVKICHVNGWRRIVHVTEDMDGDLLLKRLADAYESIRRELVAERIRNLVGIGEKKGRAEGQLLTSDISRLMEAVDRRRGDIVPCLLGAPGIGKTEGIEEFARAHGRNVVHIIASQVLPTEVSGMTMPNQETHSMDVFDHARLSRMRDGDVLFLDELLKGQQQVLSACLTLVQERRLMSGTHLPDVIIVAAANPLASAKMLPEEIRQRFLFVDVEFDEDSWCDYMRERGVPHPERLTRLLVTSGDGGADWNTLTPRTATKLTLWYRDSDHDPIVANVIRSEFGDDVLSAVANSLGRNVAKRRDPMDEVREFIEGEMSKLPDAESDDDAGLRREVANMLHDPVVDVPTLIARIQGMSGGSAIMEALRNESIDLSMTGIGEE